MAKQSSAPDADDASAYKAVFIDTNLDTHLALIVSDFDTVSDLKKRIQFEHPRCFPNVGKIQIHAIKVKRGGYFYHLSDSMSVSSAFNGVSKSWFLSVDASGIEEHGKNQHLLSPVCSNQGVCPAIANNAVIGIIDIPLSCPPKRVSSCNNFLLPGFENRQDEKEQVPEQTGKEVLKNVATSVEPSANCHPGIPFGTITEMQNHCCVDTEIPSSHIEGEVDGSSKGVNDECNVHVGGASKAIPSAIKKRKSKRKKEDVVHDDFKENNDTVLEPSEDAIQQDIIVHENPPEEEDREASMRMGENNIANGLCVNSSPNTCKRSSTGIKRPHEEFKETEVLKEHLECNEDNSKNGIDIACNESMREPAEPGPVNKRHNRRKKSLTHDSKEETLKSEIASQKSDEACKRTEEPREEFEFNNEKSSNGIDLLHNKSSEEAAVTRPYVKKKKKMKERSGDDNPLRENRSIICDSIKETLISENASDHLLEDQKKIEHSNAEQPSEHFDGGDPLRTSALHGKRKRKKDLIPHQTVIISSSMHNGEAEQSRIHGSDVQDAISEDGHISKDISMNEAAIDNTEMRTGACKEGVPSEIKETRNSEKHVNMEGHPSDVNEPRDLSGDDKLSMHGNIALDSCNKSDPCQTDQAEEEREISLKNDPKPILLGNCTLSDQDKADTNIREVTETSKALDSNGITEPEKPKRKRRKTRKTKESGGGPELAEGIGPVDAPGNEATFAEFHEATNCNPTSGNTKKEENLLNQREGKNGPQEEMKGTSDEKEIDYVKVNDAGSSEQIGKTRVDAEKNVDEKKRKISKKKQSFTAKSRSDMVTKDQLFDHKEPLPSSESRPPVETSSKIAKKNKLASNNATNKSIGSDLQLERDSIGIDPPQIPSSIPDGNEKLGPLDANETGKHSTHSFGNKDDNHLPAPSKSDKINDDQHFVSEQQQHKAILPDNMNGDVKLSGKKKQKVRATKGKSQAGSVGTIQHQGLLSKAEGDGLKNHSGNKVLKVHKAGQEASLFSQSNSVTSTINKNRKPLKASGKIMQMEKRREPSIMSNSKLEGSKKMLQYKAGKNSANNTWGVVSNAEQKKKSLLSGAIFKDDSSGSSEDEVNSIASTRIPSDNSLSSDYSDGESNAGSYGEKRLENGGRSAISAGPKGMTTDKILRGSSTFKKAKLTASQLEETESPLVFVPDSQPNM